ncbi:unnamed protein product, partial [Oppiella nova]
PISWLIHDIESAKLIGQKSDFTNKDFMPISWLIHDIESAKLIGQKSDFTNKDLKEDMMTSDMTPDINGNFNRESKRDVYEGQDSRKHITNRVSDSHTTSESITDMDEGITTEMVPTNKEPALKQTIKDDLFTNSDMRLALESNRYKWLAKKQLDEEIMYSPEVWRKQEDFMPISWLIHDIESAKLIGQKSDFTNKDLKEDMMTSDMTPDINGNFNRESKRDVYVGQDSRKHITNRVSDSHTTSESITEMDEGITTEMVPTNKEPALKQTIKDDLFTNSDMRLEVYELPGANKYMGLASNRTVVHKAPEVQPTVPSKTQMLKNNVKVSENSKNNYYFKNVLNRRALKTKKWF